MQSFFSDVPHPPEHLLPQNVHILMDRTTGKTFNFAFIELAVTPQQAGLVVQARHLKLLKGRVVSVELSNQNELMRSVFPKWSGEFIHGDPVIPGEQLIDPRTSSIAESPQEEGFSLNAVEDGDHQDVHEGASNHPTTVGMDSSLCRSNLRSTPLTKGTLSGSSTNSISAALGNVVRAHVPAIPAFVTRDEINALLVVCRNYKVNRTRVFFSIAQRTMTGTNLCFCVMAASLFSKVRRAALREYHLYPCQVSMASTPSRVTPS